MKSIVSLLSSHQRFARMVSITALWLCSVSLVSAKPSLKVLAWPGYADPEIVAEFTKRYDVDVEVTYVESDDDLWYKLNHEHHDVFAANTAELQRYIAAGISVPLDAAKIANRSRQLPRFRDLATFGLIHAGRAYAIPYTYAEMGLIYDRRKVTSPPRSMSVLWDPAYRQRVLAFNTSNHNFTLVGLLSGAADPFSLGDAELNAAARRLAELRRNVLTFYTSAEEAGELYAKHDIALIFGNYGNQQIQELRRRGADIGYVIPDEGALAWLDCWALTRNAGNTGLAERWIDFMLEPQVGAHLTERHGLANTTSQPADLAPDAKLIWLEPIGNPERQKTLWDRIISGDAPEAF